MSWFKLDDRFFDNPKIAALSDSAKVAYLEAGTYCARELTDGYVPLVKAKAFAGKPRVVKELVPHLWEPCSQGFRVHDYLKYNPTREQVIAEREAAKRRMFGLRSGVRSGEQQANVQGEVRGTPVDPVDPVTPMNDPDLKRIVGERPLPFEPPSRKTRLVTQSDLDRLAVKYPTLDVPILWDTAQNYARSKGKTYVDWVAFLDGWCRREVSDERNGIRNLGANAGQSRRSPGANSRSSSRQDPAAAAKELLRHDG